MSSTNDVSGGTRCFSGESEDYREYKRWKLWLVNKFQTLDKLPKDARGSYLFTCLTGKALETVEHVDPSEYQKEGGEKVLLKLLDARFPERDESDELGEVLNEVFNLRAREGESLRSWVSRATDLFDRCERKSGVKFPEEARGFMILRWSGLNEEQQAVVKGRSLGVLKREEISKAMRSCYPDFVVGKRRAVALVQDEMDDSSLADNEVAGFEDIEMFLADHETPEQDESGLEFPEGEVAEVLAATWKEKRAEIARLQKSRRFDQARDAKRSFRIEIEEMKRKTKCNRCGRIGHWARECRQKRDPTSSSQATSSTSGKFPAKETAAGYVAYDETQPSFVASVGCCRTLMQQLLDRRPQAGLSVVLAAVVKGDAPLLLSRPALKRLGATLDFENDRISLFSGSVQLELKSNAAGQYVLDVMNFPQTAASSEVSMVEPSTMSNTEVPDEEVFGDNGDNDKKGINGDKVGLIGNAVDVHPPQSDVPPVLVPAPSQEGVSCPPSTCCSGVPHNASADTAHACHAMESISASKKKGGITKKQLRKLKNQVKHVVKKPPVGKKYAVVKVFCPPRFVPEVEKRGLRGLSLDIKNGWDLDDPKTQDWVLEEMRCHPPELMVLCPPCTDAGGWFHLNVHKTPIMEVLRRRLLLKKQREFCKKLITQQIASGGRFMFEHPSPACTWDDPQFVKWSELFPTFNTHMCCFDLHVPATEMHPKQLIKKSTRLLCSHEDMRVLQRLCPGAEHPDHACNRVVAGSEPEIGQVSKHAGVYTPRCQASEIL
eukprot:s154_g90.t1